MQRFQSIGIVFRCSVYIRGVEDSVIVWHGRYIRCRDSCPEQTLYAELLMDIEVSVSFYRLLGQCGRATISFSAHKDALASATYCTNEMASLSGMRP